MAIGARYTGNLRDMSFAEVLRLIAEQRETGVLGLRREKVEKAVAFREGRIVQVDSSLAREGFPRACLTRGKMAVMAVVGLADQAAAEGRPPEAVAESQRVLAPGVIAALREEAQLARLFEIFSWRQGEFFFDLAAVPDAEEGAFPDRPLAGLILDGLRDATDPGRVRALFRQRMDLVPVLRALPDKEADGFALRPTELRVARAVDRRATVEEIVGDAAASAKETLALLYALEVLGFVDLLDPLEASRTEAPRADDFDEYTFDVLEYSRMVDRDHPRIMKGNYFGILGFARDFDEEALRRTYYGLAQ